MIPMRLMPLWGPARFRTTHPGKHQRRPVSLRSYRGVKPAEGTGGGKGVGRGWAGGRWQGPVASVERSGAAAASIISRLEAATGLRCELKRLQRENSSVSSAGQQKHLRLPPACICY